jgi:hypothetical protein
VHIFLPTNDGSGHSYVKCMLCSDIRRGSQLIGIIEGKADGPVSEKRWRTPRQ